MDDTEDDVTPSVFDYAGFEQQADSFEREPPPMEPEAPKVSTRETLEIGGSVPPGCTYSIFQVGPFKIVSVAGRVNEEFPGREIGEQLSGQVIFDLEGASRVTSFGIRAWLEMMKVAKFESAFFFRASPAVVSQVSMMGAFCGDARVHSVVAPYRCLECEHEYGVVLDGLEDRARFESRNAPLITCPSCSEAGELDEDPWAFLSIDPFLISEPVPGLDRACETLRGGAPRVPVEQSLEGETVHVKINSEPAPSVLHSVADGLEGDVVLDLTGLDQSSERVAEWAIRVAGAVRSLSITGVPVDLLPRLLTSPPAALTVQSVKLPTVSPGGRWEPAVVSLSDRRGALGNGTGAHVAGLPAGAVAEAADLALVDLAIERWSPISIPAPSPKGRAVLMWAAAAVAVLAALAGGAALAVFTWWSTQPPPPTVPVPTVVQIAPAPEPVPEPVEVPEPAELNPVEPMEPEPAEPEPVAAARPAPRRPPPTRKPPAPPRPRLTPLRPTPVPADPPPEEPEAETPEAEAPEAEAPEDAPDAAPDEEEPPEEPEVEPAPEPTLTAAGWWQGNVKGRPLTLTLQDEEGVVTGRMATQIGTKEVDEAVSGTMDAESGTLELVSASGDYRLTGSITDTAAFGDIEVRGRNRGKWSAAR